ncbi:zinc-binding alcohol dehydrogenase [Geomicrobium sp. JCM 19039]|uniref:zinc-dependent alcohol dehydrogenase n=1 Tax=Geomicrobium sp. JCM 19039 TaxID=1460636 RepID=UPI00045F233D|nr:zinc-binding alcohol dehydrogenase [Geomicrobium sp. JCM 19039]GAK14423.1 threonine dehydrogenase [Geomicrobium sp. JCM 19039]
MFAQSELQLIDKQTFQWKTESIQKPKHDEVLVQTLASSISIGAELSAYFGAVNVYPIQTGYENVAEVVQIGNEVNTVQPGDRVVAFYGHKNIEICKENQVILLPDHVNERAALLAILSCDAAKGVRKLAPRREDRVVISGMGVIGLWAVYYLKQFYGVRNVDVIEPNAARMQLAKTFGAKEHVDEGSHKLDGYYDYGLECSASNRAFGQLQRLMCTNGSICLLSDGNSDPFELTDDYFRKELTLFRSSDGWNYREHFEWFFQQVSDTPYVYELFEQTIEQSELIECFH